MRPRGRKSFPGGGPAVLAAALLLAGGCATVPGTWQEQVKTLPRIGIGDPRPAEGPYVVHLPAGKPVPMRILLQGDLFERETAQEVRAVPKKDIYLYKNLVSFDMETWRNRRSAIRFGWDVTIPSYDNPNPGQLKITVDEIGEGGGGQ